jgi:hypothetical protein
MLVSTEAKPCLSDPARNLGWRAIARDPRLATLEQTPACPQAPHPDSSSSPAPESGQQMSQVIRDRRRERDSDCAMAYGRTGADDIVETPAAHRFAPMWRRLASTKPRAASPDDRPRSRCHRAHIARRRVHPETQEVVSASPDVQAGERSLRTQKISRSRP